MEKQEKRYSSWKGGRKIFLLDDIVLYIGNPAYLQKKSTELCKTVEYKITVQKNQLFFYILAMNNRKLKLKMLLLCFISLKLKIIGERNE